MDYRLRLVALVVILMLGAGVGASASADPRELADRRLIAPFRERPLVLPTLAASDPCPVDEPRTVSAAFAPVLGDGLIAPVLSATVRAASDGRQAQPMRVLWVSEAVEGPVLLRAWQLDGDGTVSFGTGASQGPEIMLSSGGTAWTPDAPTWFQWPSYVWLTTPGCYAIQADSQGHSDVVVFEVIPW